MQQAMALIGYMSHEKISLGTNPNTNLNTGPDANLGVNPDADMPNTDIKVPEPFKLSTRRGPFTVHNGPWFHWADNSAVKGGEFRQGIRLMQRHCNSRAIVHGGFLASFADGLAATAVFRETGQGSVTIKLNTEYLRVAQAGDWLQGTAHVIRRTGTMAFAEAIAWVGEGRDMLTDELVFSAHAVFRLQS